MAITDGRSPATHYDAVGNDEGFISRFRVSFATNNLTTADQLVVWEIPAKTRVEWVAVETITGETGEIDIGDYSDMTTPTAIDADGWIDGMDIGTDANVGDSNGWADAATAGADSTAGAAAYSATGGKTYFTASYLLINNLTAVLNSGIIDVYVKHSRFGTHL
jgi:hypothetical protein